MTKQQFIELVSAEQESLRRFLRGLCAGDGFLADDIAQEALLKAYLSFERFEGRSRFSTWLFRIAYNCWYDHLRKINNAGWEQLDDGGVSAYDAGPADEADSRFRFQDLYMAIRSLKPLEQAVILLFYMEEKSIKEIESITGMPSGTVRSYLSRGREKLRRSLK